MLLWVSTSLLTLAVTAILVWPLLARRAQPLAPDDELQRRVAVFRDRRSEILADAAAGRIDAAQAEQAQTDLLRQVAEELPPEWLENAGKAPAASGEARLGPDAAPVGPGAATVGSGGVPVSSARVSAPTRTAAPATRSRAPFFAGVLVAVALPVLAFGVYRGVGAPEVALAQLQGTLPALADSPQARFDALVAEIEARLKADPSDGEAWAVLAEAYKLIGNHGAALEAFAKATELLPPNARLLADYAESTALAAGGNFEGRPTELLEQALQADPNDQKAVALMGAARYRAGDLSQARHFLGRLLASLPPESPEAAQIGEVLARIETELGEAPRGGAGQSGPNAPAAPSASAGPNASVAPDASAVPAEPAASSAQATPAAAGLRGTITLAPSLSGKLPDGATLFVVARAAGGPRIPIAVLRVPAASLPYQFELGDANAMDPSRPLSSADEIVLEARLSRSGDAMRQPGDLYGQAPAVKAGAREVTIVIDRVVGE